MLQAKCSHIFFKDLISFSETFKGLKFLADYTVLKLYLNEYCEVLKKEGSSKSNESLEKSEKDLLVVVISVNKYGVNSEFI